MLPSRKVPFPIVLLELLISSATLFCSFDVSISLLLKGYKLFRIQWVSVVPQLKMKMWSVSHLSTIANDRDNLTCIDKSTNFFQEFRIVLVYGNQVTAMLYHNYIT